MVVISMNKCPSKIRGDLSKWLLEVNTGVYVGRVNARVREALWKRICDNIGDGQAVMCFSTNNEQHFDFYVHNTIWKPVDLDGIKLMKHPRQNYAQGDTLKNGFSNEAKRLMSKRRRKTMPITEYAILDIETTGLSVESDHIIEVGVILVSNGVIIDELEALINYSGEIPKEITKLTGINEQMLKENGKDIKEVLTDLFDFIIEKTVVIYNASFDMSFISKEAEINGIEIPKINIKDALVEAKDKIKGLDSYKLEALAKHFGIDYEQKHHALEDCKLLHRVYTKLNEN